MNDTIRPPVLPGASPHDLMRRPGVITLVAVLCALFGAMVLLAGAAFLVPGVRNPAAMAIGMGLLLLAGLHLAAAVGLWRLQGYGRTLLIVLSCLGLVAVPIGTLVSILLLIYLTRPGVPVLFSGIDPSRLSADQAAALRDVRKSGLGIAVGVVLVVFGMIGGVGVAAAIAIPNLLSAVERARQMRAAADLQGLGERLENFARVTGSYPAAGTMDDLTRALGAGKSVTIPTTDPWGHPYRYVAWMRSTTAHGPDAYLLASAGMDGLWEDTEGRGYALGLVKSFNGDIVFSNGQFIRAPAAVQSRPTGRP